MASVKQIQIEIDEALLAECKRLGAEVERLTAENERLRVEIVGSLTEAGIAMLAEGATSEGEIPSAVARLARERDLAAQAWYKTLKERNQHHAAHQLELERHRTTWTQLEQAKREKTKLVEFVSWVREAPVSSGVCVCGESMNGYHSKDHSPVDMWDHALTGWLAEIEPLMREATDENAQ